MAEPTTQTPGQGEGLVSTLETENVIDTYKVIADWIRFADAKAAVVLAVAGTLAGLLIPRLEPCLKSLQAEKASHALDYLTLAAFGLWFVIILLSAIYSFLCIVPYSVKGDRKSTRLNSSH